MDSKTPAQGTADKMKSVKAACDKVTVGPKKDSAKNDSDCNRELDAAKHALA